MSVSVPAIYYRGGTSKAVFFHEKDIPSPGPLRDAFCKRVMGSPDPMQIDGMGGTHIVTSKIAIIRPSEREGVDIDYTFTQVAISDDVVSYSANCGNISSAVAPFAISEGLVKSARKGVSMVKGLETREVRVFNTGTQKTLISHVPVDSETGEVIEEGDFSITGVPGKAAPILMDYSNTTGASLNKGILPTGNIQDTIEVAGQKVTITVCDVANLIVMVDASVAGMQCTESAEWFNDNKIAIAAVKEVRGKTAQLLGMCKDWEKVDEQAPMLPMVMLVAPYTKDNKADIAARLILDNRCHDSMAGTGAVCLAACTRVLGSVANQKLRKGSATADILNISHPIGVMPVSVTVDKIHSNGNVTFRTLSFVRTARKLMSGVVYVPRSLGFTPNIREAPSTPLGPVTDVPVTQKFAEFVVQTQFKDLSPTVINKLKEFMIDNAGITARAAGIGESSPSFIEAMTNLSGSSGRSTVLSKGQGFGIETAAMLNAAFAHTFDFDDTFAAGASHPGAAIIATALAQGEAMNASGQDVLTALAIGYEVSTRLARALGTGGYARGFHNTGTTGVFGAVAVLAKLKNLSTTQVDAAFGLAGSRAAGSMQFLDNGSWNKRLHPGFAARDAFLCIALAEAGVQGSSRAIEGTYGLLHSYSSSSSAQGLTDGLGKDWVFLSTALKPFPACRMTHAALELAADMGNEKREGVEEITVHLSPSCWAIVGKPDPNKRHPVSIVDAQFSCYFQVANAWLYGSHTGWDAYEKIRDSEIVALLDHVHCVADGNMPDLAAELHVSWKDGTTRSASLVQPLGEESRPFSLELVRAKFESLAGPVYGRDGAARILDTLERLDSLRVPDLTALLK